MDKLRYLDTQKFFRALVAAYSPDIVCDVGTWGAENAFLFRKLSPSSNVHAFESLSELQAIHPDIEHRGRGIVLHDVDEFRRHKLPQLPSDPLSGESLTPQPVPQAPPSLQNMIGLSWQSKRQVALWIEDTSMSSDVLNACKNMRDELCMLHVQIDGYVAQISPQESAERVQALAEALGLVLVAKHSGFHDDMCFLRKGFWQAHRRGIGFLMAVSWMGPRWARRWARLLGLLH